MKQFRKTIDLCGTWDFCPLYGVHNDLSLPEVNEYTTITVPSNYHNNGIVYKDIFKPYDIFEYPDEWNESATAVYRRTVTIPDGTLDGEHAVLLHCDNIAQKAAFYVNGQRAAEWDELYLPLTADITHFLKGGENVIEVVVTDYEKVKIASGAEKLTYLAGSFWNNSLRGIWGNISLEILPKTYISDVIVRTSVREKTIEIITELSQNAEDAVITAEICDGDEIVKVLSGKVGSIKEKWADPILWDTENPHLYTAKVVFSLGGETVDIKDVRFGFREVWHEGTQFILNGTPINLRGDSWHFQGNIQMTKEYAHNWYKLCRENGVNYIRLHAEPHPSYYLDAADEDGMLIVDETAIYGSGKTMDAAHPDYIENCRKHVKRLVKRDRNHPCVFFWSLENEMRWVDGRDVYKKYIPELMGIFRAEDPTRPVSMDGDNRLLPYDQTELESLHYNIDGTLEQWKREKPLTIGEHGGMWYVCPQNASAYVGLKAYEGFEPCAKGFAMKERLFQEDARRKGVSGISTFNFAYYFTRSMPDEDVYVDNAPFKKIPKYSLTINNGYLNDYPMYRENPLMPFMREAYRPVTIIGREYNKSFYTGEPLCRTFDVYNDTLSAHETSVKYTFTVGGKVVLESAEKFTQSPAEAHLLTLSLDLPDVTEKTEAKLTLTLFHEDKEMFSGEWDYNIYPASMKTAKSVKAPVFFYGDEGLDKVSALSENVKKIDDISDASDGSVLVLGAHLDKDANTIAEKLDRFVSVGGSLVVLEQSTMGIGDLTLYNRDFFSAHSSDYSHPLLRGLSDDDMIFWGPTVTEDRPEPIIHRNFAKPQSGEYTFVLESDAGDYADGGDLWSPLMTMNHGGGRVVLCQLELCENYEKVPQACVLLKNILDYAAENVEKKYNKVYALGEKAKEFVCALGVQYDSAATADECSVVLADMSEADENTVKAFLDGGKTVLTLPFGENECDKLEHIAGAKVTLRPWEISQATLAADSDVTKYISLVDLFRYDKVPMSPRIVENRRIAHYGIECGAAETLIENVVYNLWEYKIWGTMRSEPCIIPSVSLSREKEEIPVSLLSEIRVGNGRLLLSELKANGNDEKDVNVYSKLLENLSVETKTKLFTYRRTSANDAIDYFMTLVIPEWQDFDAAREYFSDPQYSLNNLGEGLYGWMTKVEKDHENGFFTVPSSAGKRLFMTVFADKETEETVSCSLESNIPLVFRLNGVETLNGEVKESGEVVLKSGANRICLEAVNTTAEDIRFRMILTRTDGTPIPDLRTHVTIDEVDPK